MAFYNDISTAGTNLTWNNWQTGMANIVWPVWVNQTYATNAMTSTTGGATTWTIWVDNNSAISPWPVWVNSVATTTYSATPIEETPETYLSQLWSEWADLNETQRESRLTELRRRQEAREATEREARRLQWEAAEANERARQLLESVLDDEQRATYSKDKVIYLTSERRRRYRLRHDGSVHLLDEKGEHAVASFCIHPTEHVPMDDHVAAKVLYLKYAEADFERIANRSDLRAFQRAG